MFNHIEASSKEPDVNVEEERHRDCGFCAAVPN